MAAILVGERDCRTQFWKRTIQWLFHQSLVLIELLVPDKMVFMWISHRVLCYTTCKFSCAAILVRGWNHQTQFWKRTIQWLFYQSLLPNEQLVPDKKIFMWISHRILCYAKFGCGGHLGWRAEPPDTFLEENHPMTISSKFSSYWANGFRQEDLYGNMLN